MNKRSRNTKYVKVIELSVIVEERCSVFYHIGKCECVARGSSGILSANNHLTIVLYQLHNTCVSDKII